MFAILLFLVFILTKPVIAVSSLTIVNKTGNIITGVPFTIGFVGTSLSPGASYYAKAYGGLDINTSQIYTFNNNQQLSVSTAWTSFPSFIVDTGGSISSQVGAICPAISGIATLKLRLALVSDTTKQVDAESQAITINSPSPTQTPTVTLTLTPSPTSVPTSTLTPFPTNTPAATSTPSITVTPKATSTLSPTSTSKPSITLTPTLEPPLTPINDPYPTSVSDTPTPEPIVSDYILPTKTINSQTKSTSTNYLPLIFIVIGALLLIVPLAITKIKK